eukprot:920951-Amorphochlora_amoeboformis.AAC.2
MLPVGLYARRLSLHERIYILYYLNVHKIGVQVPVGALMGKESPLCDSERRIYDKNVAKKLAYEPYKTEHWIG